METTVKITAFSTSQQAVLIERKLRKAMIRYLPYPTEIEVFKIERRYQEKFKTHCLVFSIDYCFEGSDQKNVNLRFSGLKTTERTKDQPTAKEQRFLLNSGVKEIAEEFRRHMVVSY